ncbi:hypothetical protein OIU78_002401 [Salix suchowensis]|nr:hypothetical protein OIU78_002401 [Salix suchowensis]
MGISFSCSLAESDDLDDPDSMKSYGSGKVIFEEYLGFKEREMSATLSFKSTTSDMDVLARSILSPKVGERVQSLELGMDRPCFINSAKESPADEEDESIIKKDNLGSLREQPDADLHRVSEATSVEILAPGDTDSRKRDSSVAENANLHASKLSRGTQLKIPKLEIPTRGDVLDAFKTEELGPRCQAEDPDSPGEDGYETAEDSFLTEEDFMITKRNLFAEDDEEEEDEEPVPKEKILKRIDSHKGMKSYQLAEHLSSKWTTGAGPRIGCMRDYPSELQFRVLEHANLSPRSRSDNPSPRTSSRFSPKVSSPMVLTPASMCKETSSRSSLAPDQVLFSQTANP